MILLLSCLVVHRQSLLYQEIHPRIHLVPCLALMLMIPSSLQQLLLTPLHISDLQMSTSSGDDGDEHYQDKKPHIEIDLEEADTSNVTTSNAVLNEHAQQQLQPLITQVAYPTFVTPHYPPTPAINDDSYDEPDGNVPDVANGVIGHNNTMPNMMLLLPTLAKRPETPEEWQSSENEEDKEDEDSSTIDRSCWAPPVKRRVIDAS